MAYKIIRYANYVKKISDTLAKYKTDVDTLEGLYRADKQKVQAKDDEMNGKWTDAYINQYLAEHNPDKNYKAYETEQTANPYNNLELPDMENTYNSFKSYSQSAKGLLYQYAGTNAEMSHLLDVNTPNYVVISMDSYIRNNAADEFSKVVERANSILLESKIKCELTEQDKKFIDTLIDPAYPSLAKERVKKLAEYDSDIESLLLLDERYAGFLEE